MVDGSETGVILDLEGLSYMSSAGLRTILITAKRLQESRTKFALCSLRETIKEIIQIAGFDRIIDVCDTRGDAVTLVS